MTPTADLARNIDRLIAEKIVLRDALKFAIEIIGHPDDDGTKFLQKVLAETEPHEMAKHK